VRNEGRSGWLTFVAILMFAVGFVRIVSAIRYFDHGQEIINLTAGLSASASGPGESWFSLSPRSPSSAAGHFTAVVASDASPATSGSHEDRDHNQSPTQPRRLS
jgi:hypothetical protein